MASWYVLKCRPGFEIKAADEVFRAGVVSYCPQIRKRVRRRRRGSYYHVDIWRPLFLGYILAETEPSALSGLCELDYINRVIKRAGADTPAPVPDGIIEMIRTQEEIERVKYDKNPLRDSYKPGDHVLVPVGNWGKLAGVIRSLDSRGAITVIVNLLGAERGVKVTPAALVRLESAA